MRASDEMKYLQSKLDDGSLDPDEPLFTLRAQDVFASGLVITWCTLARQAGVCEAKVREARNLFNEMIKWNKKKLPD